MNASEAKVMVLRRACATARTVLADLHDRTCDDERARVRDALQALDTALAGRPLTADELAELTRRGRHAAGVRAGTHHCATCEDADRVAAAERDLQRRRT